MSRAPPTPSRWSPAPTDGLGRALAERLAAIGHDRPHPRPQRRRSSTRRGRRSSPRPATSASTPTSPTSPRLADVARPRRRDRPPSTPSTCWSTTPASAPACPTRPSAQESADGIELRFAVNYLAGFVLTERLLPLLERSAPARIVMVASLGQAALDFDDPMLETLLLRRPARLRPVEARPDHLRHRPRRAPRPRLRGHRQRPPPLHLHADEDRPRAARRLDRHASTAASTPPSASPSTPSSTASPAASSTAKTRSRADEPGLRPRSPSGSLRELSEAPRGRFLAVARSTMSDIALWDA